MLEIATRVAARNAVEPVTCNTVVAADAPPTRVKASRPARIVLEVFKVSERLFKVNPSRFLHPMSALLCLRMRVSVGATTFTVNQARTTSLSLQLWHKDELGQRSGSAFG